MSKGCDFRRNREDRCAAICGWKGRMARRWRPDFERTFLLLESTEDDDDEGVLGGGKFTNLAHVDRRMEVLPGAMCLREIITCRSRAIRERMTTGL